ncbi:MAG: hypothetical protein FWF73_03855 [Spirochaetes bacterium]|nr:hypothetical protein [Spirochaetota bacterium]
MNAIHRTCRGDYQSPAAVKGSENIYVCGADFYHDRRGRRLGVPRSVWRLIIAGTMNAGIFRSGLPKAAARTMNAEILRVDKKICVCMKYI